MIRTKDSVEDLRKSRKRSQPTGSKATTPYEELQQMAKKRRANVDALFSQRQTKVSFDLGKNRIQYRSYDEKDLKNAWNSRAEAAVIKLTAHMTVETYQKGKLDNETDCIRGLEVHADAARTEDKISRSHTFISRILEQQHFLKSVMGKANEQILAKMSQVLSAQDVSEARENGKRDANTALYITACDEARRLKACCKATDKITEDFARRLKSDDLVNLLKHHVINSV